MTYQETPYQKTNIVDVNGNVINSFGGSGGGSDATATNQQTEILRLEAIRDRLPPSLGPKTGANSLSLVFASDMSPMATEATLQQVRDRLPNSLVSGRLSVDGSGVIQPVSLSAVPLANNAATETTLQQVRDAIKAQIAIASTVFTDNSGAFYIRRDLINEGTGAITITFTDPSGNAATPGSGLRPMAAPDKDVLTDFYDVLTNGTGYSVGDLLSRVTILDLNSGTASATFIWLNLTTGTILSSAPTSSNIERANENIGARQIGNWAVAVNTLPVAFGAGASNTTTQRVVTASDSPEVTRLISIDTKTPSLGTNTAANSQPFTIASDDLIALAIRDRLPSSLGSKTAVNSLSVALATDGIFAVFAGLASDSFSATGSIHAKLGAIASTQYSNWLKLQTAPDLSQAFTYLDSGTSDERINTITYSSISANLTITETYTYAGSAGSYRISGIVRS